MGDLVPGGICPAVLCAESAVAYIGGRFDEISGQRGPRKNHRGRRQETRRFDHGVQTTPQEQVQLLRRMLFRPRTNQFPNCHRAVVRHV